MLCSLLTQQHLYEVSFRDRRAVVLPSFDCESSITVLERGSKYMDEFVESVHYRECIIAHDDRII
jgi:hypothetical protein